MKTQTRIFPMVSKLVLILCFFSVMPDAFAQVHYENFLGKQPLGTSINYSPGGNNTVLNLGYEAAAVNNLGSFVAGANGTCMQLFGNPSTNGIADLGITTQVYSYGGEKSIALATNHNTQVAVVTVIESDTSVYGYPNPRSAIAITLLNSSPYCIDIQSSIVLKTIEFGLPLVNWTPAIAYTVLYPQNWYSLPPA